MSKHQPVTLERGGKTKTVARPEDVVKAKFDGWKEKPKARAKAKEPETK